MRVAIANNQVPFVRGGAELLAENLLAALVDAGHEAEIISLPFKWYPPDRILDHMLASRLMKIEQSCGKVIDRVIGLRFPAYLMPHANKVMWVLHQYRAAYDTWDSPLGDLINWPEGQLVRNAIYAADRRAFQECTSVYTLSNTVSARLQKFNGVSSTPLYHPPPGAERLHPGRYDDYILVPSRIDRSKRQFLAVEALARTTLKVKAIFIGGSNAPDYEDEIRKRCEEAGLNERVEWRGSVSEEEKVELYANALAVAFLPIDEDYGYVTLEAMLSAKPVITCRDSGTPLEFVTDGETGFIRDPDPEALSEAFDELWAKRSIARRMGASALDHYTSRNLSWNSVLSHLLA